MKEETIKYLKEQGKKYKTKRLTAKQSKEHSDEIKKYLEGKS